MEAYFVLGISAKSTLKYPQEDCLKYIRATWTSMAENLILTQHNNAIIGHPCNLVSLVWRVQDQFALWHVSLHFCGRIAILLGWLNRDTHTLLVSSGNSQLISQSNLDTLTSPVHHLPEGE